MCEHHFIIETTQAPQAKGACKLCGEVKVFSQNQLEYVRVWPSDVLVDSIGSHTSQDIDLVAARLHARGT